MLKIFWYKCYKNLTTQGKKIQLKSNLELCNLQIKCFYCLFIVCLIEESLKLAAETFLAPETAFSSPFPC